MRRLSVEGDGVGRHQRNTRRSGALVSVRLELEEGQRLSAAVTAGAVAELGITEGREVCCVIKAVQVRILARRG